MYLDIFRYESLRAYEVNLPLHRLLKMCTIYVGFVVLIIIFYYLISILVYMICIYVI